MLHLQTFPSTFTNIYGGVWFEKVGGLHIVAKTGN